MKKLKHIEKGYIIAISICLIIAMICIGLLIAIQIEKNKTKDAYLIALEGHGIINDNEIQRLYNKYDNGIGFEWLNVDENYRNKINTFIENWTNSAYRLTDKSWFGGYLEALQDANILTNELCEKALLNFEKGVKLD